MWFARDGRAMESDPVLPSQKHNALTRVESGASKNRTCDLSIISAAL
jgi:hypothetical protein